MGMFDAHRTAALTLSPVLAGQPLKRSAAPVRQP